MLSLKHVEPPPLLALLEEWRAARRAAGQRVPCKQALSPARFGAAAGNVAVVDLGDVPRDDARYRLVGGNLVRLYGRDISGQRLRDLYSRRIQEEVFRAFDEVQRTAEPLFSKREFQILGRSFGYTRLLLPLSWQGDRVDLILIGIFPTDPSLREAHQWRRYEEDLTFLTHYEALAERKALEDIWRKPGTAD